MSQYTGPFLLTIGLSLIVISQIARMIDKPDITTFSDGSKSCVTLIVPKNATKQELAELLKNGSDILSGNVEKIPDGCVNYEFAK